MRNSKDKRTRRGSKLRDYTQPNLSGSEKAAFFSGIIAAGAAVGILFYDSLLVSAAISALLILAMPTYKQKMVKKHQMELLMQFKDMLYSISSSVSSGRSMTEAISEAKEFCAASYEDDDYIMTELGHMISSFANGNDTDVNVLRDFASRSGLADVEDFVRAYESCKESGANLNVAISTAVELIGDKIELEDELRSRLAQKIFEGRIVGASPFLIVLMIRITAPDYISPMFQTGQGLAITTIALGLMAASILMIERINRIET